jgi:hypothetical protein
MKVKTDQPLGEIEDDEGLAAGLVEGRDGVKPRDIDNGELGDMLLGVIRV